MDLIKQLEKLNISNVDSYRLKDILDNYIDNRINTDKNIVAMNLFKDLYINKLIEKEDPILFYDKIVLTRIPNSSDIAHESFTTKMKKNDKTNYYIICLNKNNEYNNYVKNHDYFTFIVRRHKLDNSYIDLKRNDGLKIGIYDDDKYRPFECYKFNSVIFNSINNDELIDLQIRPILNKTYTYILLKDGDFGLELIKDKLHINDYNII